jgi:6-phosphogluconolactonase
MIVIGTSTHSMLNHLHQFDTNAELTHQLAQRITADLQQAIQARGSATLAVSGGSTPKLLFSELSHSALDWQQISITQVDERWVEEDHVDANARLIRECLLQHKAAAANFVGMKTATDSPFDAEAEVAGKLAAFAGPIDVVVLGMGGDGHTASFFPGASTLARALDPAGEDLCVAVEPPTAPHSRMTLSLPALLRARHRYLQITGQAKWAVLQRAALPGPVEELPIRSVLGLEESPLHIYYASEN